MPEPAIYFVSAITVIGLILVSWTWRQTWLNHLAVKDGDDRGAANYARSKLFRSSIRWIVQATATGAYLVWMIGRFYPESEIVGLAIALMLLTTTGGTSILSIVEGREMKHFLGG